MENKSSKILTIASVNKLFCSILIAGNEVNEIIVQVLIYRRNVLFSRYRKIVST